jgi:hypothetical protein
MAVSAVLPFKLRVAGKDEFHGVHAVSTSFRFHGLLRFDWDHLWIEWAGSARVQDVGALTVRDEHLPLPAEALAIPVDRLRRAALAGGWWRPRLEISAKDLAALATVPSEDQGKVRFWYARRDRATAIALSAILSRAIASASVASTAPPPDPSDDTPRTPPDSPTSASI